MIEETVPRASLYEAQTPQVFRKDILLGVYDKLDGVDDEITDDAQLVERAGHPVAVEVCDASNIKITTRGDLALGGAILISRPKKQLPRMGAFEEAQW